MSSIVNKTKDAIHKAADKFGEGHITDGDPVQEDLDRKAADADNNIAGQMAVAQQEQQGVNPRDGTANANKFQRPEDGDVKMWHGRPLPDSGDAGNVGQVHPNVPRQHAPDTFTRAGQSLRLEDEAVRTSNQAGDDLSL